MMNFNRMICSRSFFKEKSKTVLNLLTKRSRFLTAVTPLGVNFGYLQPSESINLGFDNKCCPWVKLKLRVNSRLYVYLLFIMIAVNFLCNDGETMNILSQASMLALIVSFFYYWMQLRSSKMTKQLGHLTKAMYRPVAKLHRGQHASLQPWT